MNWEILSCYFKEKIWRNLVIIAAFLFIPLVFYLYGISVSVIGYSVLLCMAVFLSGLVLEYYFYRKQYLERQRLFESLEYNLSELTPAQSRMEQDYRQLFSKLLQEKKMEKQKMDTEYQELKEYIMMWAHQIKTPITALKLQIQKMEEDGEISEAEMKQLRYMKQELFAIEEYVGMNLEYIRLDSLNADLEIRECNLEKMVKAEVRRLSSLFIAKKLSVKMENLNRTIITDEKWFSFVLGQILSNAVKYTKSGGITIGTKDKKGSLCLWVQDTGIGIAAQDIPRLFEKAFTGYNGHVDKRATGIGLYLSRRILERLGHQIAISSEVGKGTCVEIIAEEAHHLQE